MTEDAWESLGDVAARIMAKLEDDQRRVFERECRRDGVIADQQRKAGVENESVV